MRKIRIFKFRFNVYFQVVILNELENTDISIWSNETFITLMRLMAYEILNYQSYD